MCDYFLKYRPFSLLCRGHDTRFTRACSGSGSVSGSGTGSSAFRAGRSSTILWLELVFILRKEKKFLNKTSLLSMCTTDSGILSILFPRHIKTKKLKKKEKVVIHTNFYFQIWVNTKSIKS